MYFTTADNINKGMFRTVLKHTSVIRLLTLLLVIAYGNTNLYSQVIESQHLQLSNARIAILPNATEWIKGNSAQKQAYKQILLHCTRILTDADKQRLNDYGIEVYDYVTGHSYAALVRLPVLYDARSMAVVYGITDVNADWKTDAAIRSLKSSDKSNVEIVVSLYKAMSEDEMHLFLHSADAVLMQSPLKAMGIYNIKLPANRVKSLIAHYAVRTAGIKYEDVPLNYEAKSASKASLASQPGIYGGHDLNGQGVTIGVGDNVSGNCHIDIKDRIVNYNPAAYSNHGVHINGIVSGAGIIDSRGEGVAAGVKLINHLYSRIWENTPVYYPLYNMTITNNSYAAVINDCDFNGTYNVYAETIDKLAIQYKDVLHVFAAGNEGTHNCPPYPQGYATVVGGYQPAKNNLVVTSTDKAYENATDGSRGPVKDGRLKPEITAVGVNVRSTTKTEEYLTSGGTSMASPGVAGGLALLTQRYKELNSNTNPRTDILKAILLNGTTDIGNPGPDYKYGFGFMNIKRSLVILDSSWYIADRVIADNQKQYTINVPANTAQLKVMLYWHDIAASPMAPKALVNDLDLQVSEPNTTIHLPMVLNPEPSKILDNAKEGADHLNNCEQVMINSPSSGVYTITVKGTSLPSLAQDYVMSYDIIPHGVSITYPYTGAAVKANDSLYVYWDASADNNTFSLSYSTDGGGVWTSIDNAIPATQRYYIWRVPVGISSGKCKLQFTRNNTSQQYSTGNFAITPIPVVTLDTVQCPGYIRVNWTNVAGASGYEVMRKAGAAMRTEVVTGNTTCTLSGLSSDSMYYIAVRPVIDGIHGYRSLAIKRKPDDGNCSGNISDGDLMLQDIVRPVSGRKFTITELSGSSQLSLLVRNLDNVPVTSYRVSYKVNNSSWQTASGTTTLPANAATTINTGSINLFAPGVYTITVAIENLSMPDPVRRNDTMVKVIRQLNNPVISLTSELFDGFEDWVILETINDSIGISPNERWDYFNVSDTSRLRSFVNGNISIDGNRSISLDALYNYKKSNRNELQATLNLSANNVGADEVRVEFDYIIHGMPKYVDSNVVYARGTDANEWHPFYMFDFSMIKPGKVMNSGSLSLTDLLQKYNESFTTATQVKFVQNDTSLISERSYGSGMTLDNFKVYTVENDVQLLSVVSPSSIECGLSGEQRLTVKLRNGVNHQLNNVMLCYRLDSGNIVTEILGNIGSKQTYQYTFTKTLKLSAPDKHIIDIWVAASGDTYLKNDSILGYRFSNQTLVNNYPYIENFEGGTGSWYAEGEKSTWAYGMPQSQKIHKANSGSKAWKTNLAGNYNAGEVSYLYSPCFDVSSLQNPAIRFKSAMDIENCGNVLCDGAYMEYSTDRLTWNKLNIKYNNTSWYNDTLYGIWSKENDTLWHALYTPLPVGLKSVNFRYVFMSDLGAEKEGMAVDDVELFEDIRLLKESNLLSISPNPTRDGRLTIEWTAKAGADFKLAMYNTIGNEVYTTSTTAVDGYNKTTIETPHFSSGVYVVYITIGTMRFSGKVVYTW